MHYSYNISFILSPNNRYAYVVDLRVNQFLSLAFLDHMYAKYRTNLRETYVVTIDISNQNLILTKTKVVKNGILKTQGFTKEKKTGSIYLKTVPCKSIEMETTQKIFKINYQKLINESMAL